MLDVRVRTGNRVIWGAWEPLGGSGGWLRYQALIGDHPGGLARVEGWSEEGGWRVVQEVRLPAAAGSAGLSQSGPGAPWLRALALRQRHAGLTETEAATAVRDASRAEFFPALAKAPWWGCVDSLHHAGTIWNQAHLSVWGWVAHERQSVVSIEAGVHPWLMVKLKSGNARPDVPAVFPGVVGGANSGFEGEVPVPSSMPQPWPLTVFATLEDGSRQIVFSARIWAAPFAAEMHDVLPPYRWRDGWREWWRHERTISGWKTVTQWRENAATDERRCDAPIWRPQNDSVAPARRVVVVSDNFRLGGAALFAFEHAKFLHRACGWQVQVLAPEPGPLSALIEEAGMKAVVVDARKVMAAATDEDFGQAVADLAGSLAWAEADLVIVNTLAACWAVPAARAAGKPTLLYVHEGARRGRLFGRGSSAVLTRASERAVAQATHPVFVTRWTWAHHAERVDAGHFRLLPSWVDLERIDEIAARQSPRELRRRHGVPVDEVVFVCLGSICDRKGQRTLVRALQWWREAVDPAARRHLPRVYLVGASETPDTHRLDAEIRAAGLDRIHVIGETTAALEWLALADAYVCPSNEEGFPRALLEAAALRKWIVATSIPGNREMFGLAEAWLVPPADPPALARAMMAVGRCIRDGDRKRPEAARRQVERWWDAANSLPVHAALAEETIVRQVRKERAP